MALGRQVVPLVAEGLGEPRAGTENCWEIGQVKGLIPVGRRGGGKGSVLLRPDALNNLVLIHAVEPRRAADKLVPECRALRPWATRPYPDRPDEACWETEPPLPEAERQLRGFCFERLSIELDAFRDAVDELPKHPGADSRYSGQGDARCYRALPGETLGEALDLLVDYLSYPVGGPLRRALRANPSWTLRIWVTGTARIAYSDFAGGSMTRFFTYYVDAAYGSEIREPPGLVRMAEVRSDVFELLADLWAESRAQLGIDSFPSFPRAALAGAAPEDESAASSPLPGAASAHSTDRRSDEGAETPTRNARTLNKPELTVCVSVLHGPGMRAQ